MNLYLSGWAGFKEVLEDVPENWKFLIPFVDFDEHGIIKFLEDKSGQTVMGWSTGGHIILKNFHFFSERFKLIVIISGFNKFTDYVNPKVIKRMINKIELEPDSVVRDFLIKAGCKPILPKNLDKHALIEGLKFLLTSDFSHSNTYPGKKHKLTLIHGSMDKILPSQALYDLQRLYPYAEIYLKKSSHRIPFSDCIS